jgi:hypothetical protein
MLDLDADAFAAARIRRREAAAEARAARRSGAEAALERAREAFVDHCQAIYASGAGAARRDAERLESLAERFVRFVEAEAEPYERLEVAADVVSPRGALAARSRAPFDRPALAEGLAETFGETALSGPAQAVLVAAVRLEML